MQRDDQERRKDRDRLWVPGSEIPIEGTYDICVIGGGPSGVAAAVTCAQEGKSVILIERNGYLGGALTSVTLGSICGLYCVDGNEYEQVVGGFVDQVITRLKKHGGCGQPKAWLETVSLPYETFAMKMALDELAVDSNVDLLFHTTLVSVQRVENTINSIVINSVSGLSVILAGYFIDCSGDAELIARAGESFEIDLENLQYPTAMFRMGGVDTELASALSRPQLHTYLESAVERGAKLPRTAGGIFHEKKGVAHLNITKVDIAGRSPNPTNAHEMSRAEISGREQVGMYCKAFRESVPGYEQSYVLETGHVIGVRESRRLRGQYTLTAEDVLACRKFGDAIAKCSWPMEEHGRNRATKWIWLPRGQYFEIPYKAMIPEALENVLVAGRCISTTHDAQASIRVTAQCFAMGQAAGAAMAISHSISIWPKDVPYSLLKTQLLQSGALL